MLATPASTRAQASVALADLMAARVLPIPLFERSKGERSKGSLSNVHAQDLLPILCGKRRAGHNTQFAYYRAAGRLSAGKKGAAPPSAPSRLSLDGKPLPPSDVGLLPRPPGRRRSKGDRSRSDPLGSRGSDLIAARTARNARRARPAPSRRRRALRRALRAAPASTSPRPGRPPLPVVAHVGSVFACKLCSFLCPGPGGICREKLFMVNGGTEIR